MNSPLIGVDVGKKRTGISFSESGIIATPLKTIPHIAQPKEISQQLLKIIKAHKIQTVIMGIPLHEDNSISQQALWVNQVVYCLKTIISQEKLETTVILHNEFASTIDGKTLFPNIDDNQSAATIILQDYLDTNLSSKNL